MDDKRKLLSTLDILLQYVEKGNNYNNKVTPNGIREVIEMKLYFLVKLNL